MASRWTSREIERCRLQTIVMLWGRISHKRHYAILIADLPDSYSTYSTPASYDAKRKSNICTGSGCTNRTTGGKALCADCSDMHNVRRRVKTKRQRAAGVCTKCGRESGEHRQCFDCRRKLAIARREKRNHTPQGVCD